MERLFCALFGSSGPGPTGARAPGTAPEDPFRPLLHGLDRTDRHVVLMREQGVYAGAIERM
jgi:hypothetical protein